MLCRQGSRPSSMRGQERPGFRPTPHTRSAAFQLHWDDSLSQRSWGWAEAPPTTTPHVSRFPGRLGLQTTLTDQPGVSAILPLSEQVQWLPPLWTSPVLPERRCRIPPWGQNDSIFLLPWGLWPAGRGTRAKYGQQGFGTPHCCYLHPQ